MTLDRSAQHFAGFSSLCYISMSMITIGSFIIISCSACLAKALGSSALPSCSVTLGTVTSRNGQQLLITPKQGNAPIHVRYSNATHILQEGVVESSALKKGIYVQVLVPAGSNQAGVVMLNPGDNARQGSLLGCRMPQTPAATSGRSKLISSQGIIQRVTNNTFIVSLRTGQPKTFTWSTNTTFIQYTDVQSSKILTSRASVLLIGPVRKGVIIASRIAVIPQGLMKGSFRIGTGTQQGLFSLVSDLAVLAILARVFI
jgi:hypothetical protein